MKTAFTLALLLAVSPTILLGQVHKWVDENGVTVYSQTPPPGVAKTQVVAPPPPPATDPAEARRQLDETIQRLDDATEARTEGDKSASENQKKAENQAQVSASCEQARIALEELERGPPRKIMIGPDGEAKRLSYEELQAEIDENRKYIEKNCKGK